MELIHAKRSFWAENEYPYIRLVEISDTELADVIGSLSRNDIIEWLMWNDRNGVYSDVDSLREFGAVMTKEEGLEILLRQLEENRVVKKI
ncbi:MAG TPA: hypothetical protein VK616_19695 [Flavitalea sp.]|nr:hypothetical protein [Flavitalea sp.]